MVLDQTDGRDRGRPRVLIVHNWHQGISGENRSAEADIALLREAGVEVETYSRSNEEIATFGRVKWAASLTLRPVVSPGDARALGKVIATFRPDVVHIYNLFPLISPWVVRTAHAAGIPVVQTVNNYLHVCVAGTYFRDGRPCHDCQGRLLPWPAVYHGCTRGVRLPGAVGSRLKTAALGTSIAVHRPTWRLVDRFLAVGGTIARHLQSAGIDPQRISIRGDPVLDPGSPTPPGDHGALYVGRLSSEKGSRLLVDAWKRSGLGSEHRLRLAGDGPDRAAVEEAARGVLGVELLGAVSHERALELMIESTFVIVPSLWDEPGCIAAREAMARGRPVLATNLGVLPEIIDASSGWLVEPTVEGIAGGLRAAFASPLGPMGRAARRRYEERFSPSVSLRTLLTAYNEVIHRGK